MPGGSFRPALAVACLGERAREAGWNLQDRPPPVPGRPGSVAGLWIAVTNVRAPMPAQGWKLHVSASVESAFVVLDRALGVLLADPAGFKLAASLDRLAALNVGQGGRTQAGKFITVYPVDDAQAVRLAVALDRATAELRGPRVPTDRPLRPGSLVHYRYGGFVGRWLQTPLGEVVTAVEGPDGILVPDLRTNGFTHPAWAADPFVAAGVVERYPPVDLFVAGRYLTAEVLSSTPELNTRLVVDTVAGARRVLKHARGLAGAVPGDGAVARLRHEAAVLRQLDEYSGVPAVHDVFEQGEDLFVVLDHCDGMTLEQEVQLRSAAGCQLLPEALRTWGREVAGVVDTIHAYGLVYGDLKPPHVIIGPAAGPVRLVDFESAWPNPDSEGYMVLGTPGYLSPQRGGTDPPAPTDDVYSLGAVLYFMATGAEPSHAPDRRRLLDRRVEAVNPGLPADLVSLIGRCLDPRPENRPGSMAEVARLLEHPSDFRATEPSRQPGREPGGVARELALRLCRSAVDEGVSGGVTWHRDDMGSAPALRDVNGGAAGVVLALAQAAPLLDEPEVWATLSASTRWLAASAPLPGGPLPGLYVGEAGVGAALLRAGEALADRALVAAAEAKGRLIAGLPHASPDLFNGTAGRLRFHLMLWQATGREEHLADARAGGDVLLATAAEHWPVPEGYESASGKVFLGYAHGSAGIADALLDLYEATGEEDLAAAVANASAYLMTHAVPYLEDGTGLNWPGEPDGGPTAALWCHGAAGVARFLLHAARIGVVPDAAAEAASRAAAKGARWVGPSQCHGLAGNADVLIDFFRHSGEASYLDDARHLAGLLEAYLVEPDDLHPVSPGAIRSSDLMTGEAGLLACFLRLTEPALVPHVLSISPSACDARKPTAASVELNRQLSACGAPSTRIG